MAVSFQDRRPRARIARTISPVSEERLAFFTVQVEAGISRRGQCEGVLKSSRGVTFYNAHSAGVINKLHLLCVWSLTERGGLSIGIG
jgi:hypothetical protein